MIKRQTLNTNFFQRLPLPAETEEVWRMDVPLKIRLDLERGRKSHWCSSELLCYYEQIQTLSGQVKHLCQVFRAFHILAL
jgi:hypothetical protein